MHCSELYLTAIKNSPTITLNIAKAMTVGPPCVGKTFMRHHLLGLPLPKDSVSTAVMETPDMVSLSKSTTKTALSETYVASDKKWVTLKPDNAIQSLLITLRDQSANNTEKTSEGVAAQVMERASRKGDSQAMKLTSKQVDSQAVAHTLDSPAINPDAVHSDEDLEGMHIQTVRDASFVNKATYKWPNYDNTSDPMKSMISEIHQLLQTMKPDGNVNLQDAHLLQFIDCGGQLAYHDILPIFVNIPAIYLHVFKLTTGLEERPTDEIHYEDGLVCYSAESPLTVVEMIIRSMMTISALACKEVQLPGEVETEGSRKSHVAFIGTHCDRFCTDDAEQTRVRLDAISEVLKKAMPPMSPCLEVIKHGQTSLPAMFFPVNNCLDEKDVSQSSKISRKSTNCLKTGIEKVGGVKVIVPVKWYLYQLLEWEKRGKEGQKKCYRYRELYAYCAERGIPKDTEDFYAMVTYFNALGLLIHLCGPDESEKHIGDTENCDCLVFTDPSHLFENVTKLYQVQFQDEGYLGSELQSLKCNGVLRMSALEKLEIDVEHSCFMEILIHLFIGASLELKEGEKALFVPSVLTNPTDATISGVGTRAQVAFAIAFKGKSFIPCGVFAGMAARLQSEAEWEICFGSISRMHMKYKVHGLSVVTVFDRRGYIEVIISGAADSEDYQEYRNTTIEAIAESYCFLFHTKDPHSCCATCSKCSESPYLLLGKTCEHCTQRFAELHVRKGVFSVSCKGDCDPIQLNAKHHVIFENIVHEVS